MVITHNISYNIFHLCDTNIRRHVFPSESRHTSVLLTVMGARAYTNLRALCTPDAPSTKSFGELVDLMRTTGVVAKPKPAAARYVFHARKQNPSESISDFHLALRQLAQDCNFGDNLNIRLCDQLTNGLSSDRIREELFEKDDLTYKDAITFALSRECAVRDAATVQGASASGTSVNKLSQSKWKNNGQAKYKSRSYDKCAHCGRSNHNAADCYYKDATCYGCNKKGHIKPICRSFDQSNPRRKPVYSLEETPQESNVMEDAFLHTIRRVGSKPYYVTVLVENQPITMEIDTGAAVSVISSKQFDKLNINQPVENTDMKLTTYTHETVQPSGICVVQVQHNNQNVELELFIVDSDHDTIPLMGRSWLDVLQLDWSSIKRLGNSDNVETDNIYSLKELLLAHSALFNDELGTMKGFQAKISIKQEAQPKFMKFRPVPLALRAKVGQEIDRLEKSGVLTPVKYSDWATPIVPVIKDDGSVRVCGDFRITVNPVLNCEKYPQPRREDLFACLAGGTNFSKVDLANAYLQMEVDEESRQFLTVNTHKGLFMYNRLVFGISSAPAIFQRAIDSIIQGLDGVLVYQDDILITGKSDSEHMSNLAEVLRRLENHGLRLKEKKCSFFVPSLTYLGHMIDKNGVHTLSTRVQGVMDAPIPKNVSQLRSFLGTVNYYGAFIDDLSTRLAKIRCRVVLVNRSRYSISRHQEVSFFCSCARTL